MQPPAVDDVYQLKTMLKELMSEEGQFTMKALNISGNELMDEFKLEPSPQL